MEVERLNAIKHVFVTGGDTQVLGRDYNLTFSAVMDTTSGKVLLAIATQWDIKARHFEEPSAYVKAYKEDDYEIYLRVPEGMDTSSDELKSHGATDGGGLCL